MDAIRKYATVDENGRITLEGLPFKNGDFVEILIFSNPKSTQDLSERWKVFFKEIQSNKISESISDEDIEFEIQEFRNNNESNS